MKREMSSDRDNKSKRSERKEVKSKMLEPEIESLVRDLYEEYGSLLKLNVQVKRLSNLKGT